MRCVITPGDEERALDGVDQGRRAVKRKRSALVTPACGTFARRDAAPIQTQTRLRRPKCRGPPK